MDAKQKVMEQWPNLKKDWAAKIGEYFQQELNAQEQALRSTYDAREATLKAELAEAQTAHKYEASQRDHYAATNAALQQTLAELTTKVTAFEKVVTQVPFDAIEIALMPGKAISRSAYINAVRQVGDWMDTLAFDGETMVPAQEEEQAPEGEDATVLTDTALPASVVAPEQPATSEVPAVTEQTDEPIAEPVTDQSGA